MSGTRRLPAPSKVVRVQTNKILTPQKTFSPSPTVGTSTAAISTSQTRSPDSSSQSVGTADKTVQLISEKCAASVTSSSPKSLSPSASYISPVPAAAQSVVASHCLPISSFSSSSSPSTVPLSNTASELHGKFGQTSKHATIDSSRTFGVKYVVSFEKIYKFLSAIQKPSEDCHLTPMGELLLNRLANA
ncbi:hypothetical protein AMECASPLE_033681 [Ameca splendens]|uniref:Uncharacterized protein n=1 Tax=Ameca splendens TaxID=208324 RepID=A0ABV0YIM4_9TELE